MMSYFPKRSERMPSCFLNGPACFANSCHTSWSFSRGITFFIVSSKFFVAAARFFFQQSIEKSLGRGLEGRRCRSVLAPERGRRVGGECGRYQADGE